MAKTYKFEVVTPTKVFYADEVEMIIFETRKGQMGVMANHIPMLIANKKCVLKIKKDKETKNAFITEGFIEITPEKVTAIVDGAEWSDKIDAENIIDRKKEKEEELLNKRTDLNRKAELSASINRSRETKK